jgi:hypothetical protein
VGVIGISVATSLLSPQGKKMAELRAKAQKVGQEEQGSESGIK